MSLHYCLSFVKAGNLLRFKGCLGLCCLDLIMLSKIISFCVFNKVGYLMSRIIKRTLDGFNLTGNVVDFKIDCYCNKALRESDYLIIRVNY